MFPPNPTTLLITAVFLSRTWLLLIIAAASRQSGSDLLEIFYPHRTLFYIGLIVGLLPLSRLLLITLWQKVSLNKQHLVFLLMCGVDLALQVHIATSRYGESTWGQALSIWCTLMLVWLLGKELLYRKA